jgi:two-component system C4-dicarboxylate transport sensor histidine kinase DctB
MDHFNGGTSVTLTRRDGQIRIELMDNGPGMTEAVRARMFEPFFSTKGASGGFGLGLAVVYGVVTSWGGKIEARNLPGGGAAFIITLPAPADSPASAARA